MAEAPFRISGPDLARFISECLCAVDVPPADAATVGHLMAEADLNGADAHGVFRLPQYVARIRAGGINVNPDIRIVHETPAMAVVDGDDAIGHLAVSRAVGLALDKAEAVGIGWAGVRNSNHAGPAGLYARMALARGMIGIYMAVGSANHLAPWGGTDMLLSTNPIAVAVPSADEVPIVLDMATTVAAYGKIKEKVMSGEPMPEGWMIDKQGRPLTDAARADEGLLLPIGGVKGYGLSLIFGILAGTLNGAAFGRGVVDFNADDKTMTNTGQTMIAVSLDAFGDAGAFKAAIDAVIRDLKASPTLPGFDAVRLPGEGSAAKRAERGQRGIPIAAPVLEKLRILADGLGVALPGA